MWFPKSVLMLKIAWTWLGSKPIYWYLKSTNNDRHILLTWLDKNYRSPGMIYDHRQNQVVRKPLLLLYCTLYSFSNNGRSRFSVWYKEQYRYLAFLDTHRQTMIFRYLKGSPQTKRDLYWSQQWKALSIFNNGFRHNGIIDISQQLTIDNRYINTLHERHCDINISSMGY